MAISAGPSVVEDGLVFCLDAANKLSYAGTGTTWIDLAGSNNGTLTNGPTFSEEKGGSIAFDGTDDEVRISDLSTGLYTVNIWLKLESEVTSSSSPRGVFRYKPASDSSQGALSTGSVTGHVTDETLTIVHQDGSYTRTAIKDDIPSGWNNICLRWNGSTYEFYINGQQKTTYPGTGGHAPFITSDGIFLGENYVTGQPNFLGDFAIFSIHSRTLSSEEIKQNYKALRGRFN